MVPGDCGLLILFHPQGLCQADESWVLRSTCHHRIPRGGSSSIERGLLSCLVVVPRGCGLLVLCHPQQMSCLCSKERGSSYCQCGSCSCRRWNLKKNISPKTQLSDPRFVINYREKILLSLPIYFGENKKSFVDENSCGCWSESSPKKKYFSLLLVLSFDNS